jgi:hypothetical protein
MKRIRYTKFTGDLSSAVRILFLACRAMPFRLYN